MLEIWDWIDWVEGFKSSLPFGHREQEREVIPSKSATIGVSRLKHQAMQTQVNN